MNEFTKLIIVSSLGGVLSITGCKSESAPQDSSAHSAHDHADDDTHDHADDTHDHADDDGHAHGDDDAHDHADDDTQDDGHAATRPLGTVVIAGTTLEVSAGGEIEPKAELNVNIKHIDGPVPVEIRFWIGNEAGDGSMKSKTDPSGHGHGEVPATVNADTALWIEIETSSGERVRSSVPLI